MSNMKQIAEGIFVEENDGFRSYVIEADYSEHIKSIKSNEDSTQEIALREDAPAQEILEFVKEHDFDAELGESDLIFVETIEPSRLVKDLCDGKYINGEQAVAIMMHEISHIKNPLMRAQMIGAKSLHEAREVVIQYKQGKAPDKGTPAPKGNEKYTKGLRKRA